MTRIERLRARAAAHDAEADRLLAAGQGEAAAYELAAAEACEDAIRVLERLAAEGRPLPRGSDAIPPDVEARARELVREGLRERSPKRMVNTGRMLQEHRVARSKGDDALLVAAREAHHSLRTLAKAVDMSVAWLSMARRGERRMPLAKAEAIERLIGFAATKANWPGLDD